MSLAVVTPSYRNDFSLFVDLHESVLQHTDQSVKHYVIVPAADTQMFSELAGRRCIITAEEPLYPHYLRPTPKATRVLRFLPGIPPHVRIAAINLRRPLHPIRGWIMQQALKMEACRQINADVLLILDSDVMLIRDVTADHLTKNGHPRLYRKPGAIDVNLPQHVQWHNISRKLLGLPPASLPAPDYVSSLSVWAPDILRDLLTRIETVTGNPWLDAVTSQETFSEWTLYGIFADAFVENIAEASTELSLCHSYWDTEPLTEEGAAAFVASTPPHDIAVLVQSKSNTPLPIRKQIANSYKHKQHPKETEIA
jgi:hypothetical protein